MPEGRCKWFCTVTQNVGVIAKTTSLQDAQSALGQGSAKNRQAIIPMKGMKAGDPHSLPKKWSNGSMWWWNWPDINQMRAKCTQVRPVCDGYQPGTTPDPWFTDEPDWFTDEPHVDPERPRFRPACLAIPALRALKTEIITEADLLRTAPPKVVKSVIIRRLRSLGEALTSARDYLESHFDFHFWPRDLEESEHPTPNFREIVEKRGIPGMLHEMLPDGSPNYPSSCREIPHQGGPPLG